MNELQTIERNDQRVLTTAQLAESYGADEKLVQQNFSNNKARYKEGKHFFLLQGEDLRTFKRDFENLGFAPNLNKLYLWTEKGAWLHAKSLKTDEAWDAYELLVDEYYKITQEQDPITLALEAALETRKQVQAVQTDVKYLKETMRIDGVEQFQINDAGKKKALDSLGGKDAPAYKELSKKVFAELWRDFKKHFTVPRYSELPKVKYSEGMQFIGLWEPNTSMKMDIQKLNEQGSLF